MMDSEKSDSGISSGVSGDSDRLKCYEKHCPSKVAFSEFGLAVVPFLCRVGTDEVSQFRHFMAFQRSLVFGLRLQKKKGILGFSEFVYHIVPHFPIFHCICGGNFVTSFSQSF